MKKEIKESRIESLISSGNLDDAINSLKSKLSEMIEIEPQNKTYEELLDSVIIQQSKYKNLKLESINGVHEQQYVNSQRVKISKALLDIRSEIKHYSKKRNSTNNLLNENLSLISTSNDENSLNRTVQLRIEEDFEKFSENDKLKLLNVIKELLSMEDDIEIKKIRRGSIIIDIDIPKEKYDILLKAFSEGKFDEFNLSHIDRLSKFGAKRKTRRKPKYQYLRGRSIVSKNIRVSMLNFITTEDTLKLLFEEFGEVNSVEILTDIITGISEGIAYIEMSNEKDAQNAVSKINDTLIDGYKVAARLVNDKPKGGNRGDGGRSRGGSKGYNRGKK